ncbi:MAG: cyclodeaminase/cyclohydrolase family protein [Bacillota bacterium]
MRLVERTLESFVKEVASPSPAPGGGSVAALAGSLGAALGSMVCHHALKGKQVDSQAVQDLLRELDDCRGTFLNAVDADTEAFNRIMAALAIPKTDAEARKTALAAATREATAVPLQVAVTAARTMELMARLTAHARKAVASDLGAGLEALACCLTAAAYNVETNLPGVADEAFLSATRRSLHQSRQAADGNYQVVRQWVERQLA